MEKSFNINIGKYFLRSLVTVPDSKVAAGAIDARTIDSSEERIDDILWVGYH